MLVAAATVNGFRTPTLSALKQAGLEYLLCNEAQALWAITPEAAPAKQNATPRAARPPSSLPRRRPPVAEAAPATQAVRVPEQDKCETPWPAVWQEQVKRAKIAPVVWTYWELGLDLSGAPDITRRELFQTLLVQTLAHPAGTHSFWPVALPEQDGQGEAQMKPNARVFWEGVKLLGGRAVVIMGAQALDALALPERLRAMQPFQQDRHQGRLLIVLPAPATLIQEAWRMPALGEFLRRTLAPFA